MAKYTEAYNDITAGSPEGGQRGALRKVLWQDKPARGR